MWLIVEIINFLLLFRMMIIQKEETIWPHLVLEVVIFILAIGSRFYKFLCILILIPLEALILLDVRFEQNSFVACL